MAYARVTQGARQEPRSGQESKAGSNVSRPHSSVVEHFLGKEEVTGSNPVVGSKIVQIGSLDTFIYMTRRERRLAEQYRPTTRRD